jgi:hypothetical protein
MYEAMRAQKDILVDQQREQQRLRDNITGRLRSDDLPAADLAGLEKRLLQVDVPSRRGRRCGRAPRRNRAGGARARRRC